MTSTNTAVAKFSIAWLKRLVDHDTRYSQFICPAPEFRQTGTGPIANYLHTCDV